MRTSRGPPLASKVEPNTSTAVAAAHAVRDEQQASLPLPEPRKTTRFDKYILQNDMPAVYTDPVMTLKAPQLTKGASTVFLQIVLVLVGIGVLAAMLRFPQTEGRAANLSLAEVYLDPGVAYGYAAAIPFFVALYQAFKVLGYAQRNEAFSERSLRAVRTIKHCAMLLIGFAVVALVYLSVANRGQDDIAGGVALGLFITLVSSVTVAVAAVVERLLQNGADMKSENDLTV